MGTQHKHWTVVKTIGNSKISRQKRFRKGLTTKENTKFHHDEHSRAISNERNEFKTYIMNNDGVKGRKKN